MRGCLNTLVMATIIYIVCRVLYAASFETTDKDYDVGIPEIKVEKVKVDTTLLLTPSDKPYKGNWVDIEK